MIYKIYYYDKKNTENYIELKEQVEVINFVSLLLIAQYRFKLYTLARR